MADLAALTTSVTEILRELVAFDTTSRNSNLELIRWVEEHLSRHSIASERVADKTGEKASLFARIGPDAPGGIVLSGHTDVVPVDGQEWASSPFTLTEKEGKLYGRGTADMKGFLACALALAPQLAMRNLAEPFYLAFSYDEEIGCLGAPDLVAHIAAHANAPSLAVVGEPTMMQVVTAHKGVYSFETVVTGREAHSSAPHKGVNAVQVAARLVAFLADIAEKQALTGMQNADFDPPYGTIHVGVIEGGTARNIIPKQCRFLWEIRPLPGEDPQLIVQSFEAACSRLSAQSGAHVVTTPLSRMHGMQFQAESGIRQRVLASAQANATHAVSFGTEAGIFQERGIAVLVCGPGDIAQAHKPDEFIETAQLTRCLEFLLRLAG